MEYWWGKLERINLLLLLPIAGWLLSCQPGIPSDGIDIQEIPLAGALAQCSAEISGLAWYGAYLILLPQYPDFNQENNNYLYALSKSDINNYLLGKKSSPLLPIPIPFATDNIAERILGFEGFEALVFTGDTVFLTIESETGSGTLGYLVRGRIEPDLSSIELDVIDPTSIPPQSEIENMCEETMFIAGRQVITIYEANGSRVNRNPVAHIFDFGLQTISSIPMASIDYRITDATTSDESNNFWAINYFYPGDKELLPKYDPLGKGDTVNQSNSAVERLVKFHYADDGIVLIEQPPLDLKLLPDDSRNWEGLVRLEDRGFLIVTDKFPRTILAFVPFENK